MYQLIRGKFNAKAGAVLFVLWCHLGRTGQVLLTRKFFCEKLSCQVKIFRHFFLSEGSPWRNNFMAPFLQQLKFLESNINGKANRDSY